jgi:Zn-dependent protease/CBS domain-containing protein
MKWTIYLGRIAGIKLFMHWTFIILIGWIFLAYFRIAYSMLDALVGVVFIIAIFGCVILHELGHALTARRFNIGTKMITILPIGGVASIEKMPEKPRQELWVAIMGPVVNVVIASLLYLILFATDGIPSVQELIDLQENQSSLAVDGYFLFNLMVVNLALVAFNLIPAFPMDGGRVLRALLSYRMDRTKATNVAARIGQFLAIIFVFAGFYTNFWLVFIGVFIFLGAGGEANYETTKSLLSDYSVKDVVMTQYTLLSPNDTLNQAAKVLLDGQEKEFLVSNGESVQGILTRSNIIKGLSELGKEAPVSRVMRKDFIALQPEMKLQEVYQKMLTNDCSVGPVYQGSRLIGVLDRENINELLLINKALEQ